MDWAWNYGSNWLESEGKARFGYRLRLELWAELR